jgi:hypothetical protein
MHRSNYQPRRSQHLFLADKLKDRYQWEDQEVVVHHVLEDTSTRLYLQIERREYSSFGFARIFFERVEL